MRRDRQALDFGLGADDVHGRAHLADSALDLRMPAMADQNELAPLGDIVAALSMHLGDERTGGVQHRQPARLGCGADRAGDPVRAEHGDGAFGHLVEFVDKAGALGAQVLDHTSVVHDLVAHVDRGAELLQRAFDDLNGPHNPGAEPSRLSQNNAHRTISCRSSCATPART